MLVVDTFMSFCRGVGPWASSHKFSLSDERHFELDCPEDGREINFADCRDSVEISSKFKALFAAVIVALSNGCPVKFCFSLTGYLTKVVQSVGYDFSNVVPRKSGVAQYCL